MPGVLNSFITGGGGGGGGPLSVYIVPVLDPLEDYNPDSSGVSSMILYAVPSGGTPPYTYNWTRLTSPDGITPGATTTSSLTLSATGDGSPVNTDQETWQIEVTDAALATATDSVVVRFYFGLEPP
jgi:hypothetical protein